MLHPRHYMSNIWWSKKNLFGALLISALMASCWNDTMSKKEAKIKDLNHLATNHAKLRDTLKAVWFQEIWELISLTPDSSLNATVMEQSLKVFGKDSIAMRPQNARVRLYRAWFITMAEWSLQQQDLPSNTIEEKALYHQEWEMKPIEFHEQPWLYKKMIIVFWSDYEKRQFNESLQKHWKDIRNIDKEGLVTTYKYKNTTLYALEWQWWIDEFTKNNHEIKAWLIVLKWHFGMDAEIEDLKDNIVKKSTIIFAGWCGSFQSTSKYLKLWGIPITNSQTWVWAINDPLTFSLIRWLGTNWFKNTVKEYKEWHPKNDEKIVFPDEELAQKVNWSL